MCVDPDTKQTSFTISFFARNITYYRPDRFNDI